jgi:hypothetical protein
MRELMGGCVAASRSASKRGFRPGRIRGARLSGNPWIPIRPPSRACARDGDGLQTPGLGTDAAARDTRPMVDDSARELAIYHALKAVDEVAAALQTHLVEEHNADLERGAAQSTFTNSLKLLRQARERLGEGLRAVKADNIAASDDITLRSEQATSS